MVGFRNRYQFFLFSIASFPSSILPLPPLSPLLPLGKLGSRISPHIIRASRMKRWSCKTILEKVLREGGDWVREATVSCQYGIDRDVVFTILNTRDRLITEVSPSRTHTYSHGHTRARLRALARTRTHTNTHHFLLLFFPVLLEMHRPSGLNFTCWTLAWSRSPSFSTSSANRGLSLGSLCQQSNMIW